MLFGLLIIPLLVLNVNAQSTGSATLEPTCGYFAPFNIDLGTISYGMDGVETTVQFDAVGSASATINLRATEWMGEDGFSHLDAEATRFNITMDDSDSSGVSYSEKTPFEANGVSFLLTNSTNPNYNMNASFQISAIDKLINRPYSGPITQSITFNISCNDSSHVSAQNILLEAYLIDNPPHADEDNYEVLWTDQFGTSGWDIISTSSINSNSNIIVAGYTQGNLYGINAGDLDAFLRMYDSDGNELWGAQFGSTKSEMIYTSSIDDSTGNILVAGDTDGDLEGTITDPSLSDAFLRMYDSNGNELWTKQFGTGEGELIWTSTIDQSNGNIIIAGNTQGNLYGINAGESDVFLRMYDSDGNELWGAQFGSSKSDFIRSSSVDPSSGNILVAGGTRGDLEGTITDPGLSDAFLRMYDSNGNVLWAKQFGTINNDFISTSSIVPSNGNLIVAGYTEGNIEGTNTGYRDAFLRMYDSNGNELWTKQFGTTNRDEIYTSSIDSNSNILVAGYTQGDLEGVNVGGSDAFLRMYDSSGNILWTKQFGSSYWEKINTLSIDISNNNVIVAGFTTGALEGGNAGSTDAFVRVYSLVTPFNFDGNISDLFSGYIQGNYAPSDHQVFPLP